MWALLPQQLLAAFACPISAGRGGGESAKTKLALIDSFRQQLFEMVDEPGAEDLLQRRGLTELMYKLIDGISERAEVDPPVHKCADLRRKALDRLLRGRKRGRGGSFVVAEPKERAQGG